jgi:hypothetical protein
MIGSDTLLAHLRPLIRSHDGEDAVAVVAREPPRVATHHVSEILTVRCASDRMLMLLIKYDTKPAMIAGRLSTGARYEALVYERVLTPLGVTVPACYGVWRDADSGATVLARAYVNGGQAAPGTGRAVVAGRRMDWPAARLGTAGHHQQHVGRAEHLY